jgi:hypothetical protein
MNLLDLAREAIADLPDASQRDEANPAQAAELRRLVRLLFGDDTETHQAEALTAALADPVAALASFRILAAGGRR